MKRLQLEALADRWCPHAGHHEPYEPEPEIPVPETPTEPPAFVGPLPSTSPIAPPTPVTPPMVDLVGPQPGSGPVTPPVVELPPEPTPAPTTEEPQEEPTTEHHDEDTPAEVHESRMSVDGAIAHLHAFMGVAMPTMDASHSPRHNDDEHEPTHEGEHPPQHQNANSMCGHGAAPMYFVGVHNTHRQADNGVIPDEAHLDPDHMLALRPHRNGATVHAPTWPTDMQLRTYEPATEMLLETQEPSEATAEVLPENSVDEAIPVSETIITSRLQRVLGWCSLSMALLWAARTVHAKPPAKLRVHATK